VDAEALVQHFAFDHQRMADALSKATGEKYYSAQAAVQPNRFRK